MSEITDEVNRLRALADAIENGTSVAPAHDQSATTTSGIVLDHRIAEPDLLAVLSSGQRGHEEILAKLIKAVTELQALA